MNLTNTAALPLSVMIALFGLALMWGWAGEGALIALGWCGVLRIGEILQATSADLILPQDAAPGVWHVLLRIPVPKTRGRSAKHQPSRIDSEDVVSLLTAVFGRLTPCSNLWPYSASTLRKRFAQLQIALGLGSTERGQRLPYSLASLRPGGATYWLQATEDVEYVRRKGRLLSGRVLEIHLRSALWDFSRERLSEGRRVLLIVGVCYIHLQISAPLHIFSSSRLFIFAFSHLLIFHLHISSSSHFLIFSPSHLLIFSSSHLHTFSSSHFHIF